MHNNRVVLECNDVSKSDIVYVYVAHGVRKGFELFEHLQVVVSVENEPL